MDESKSNGSHTYVESASDPAIEAILHIKLGGSVNFADYFYIHRCARCGEYWRSKLLDPERCGNASKCGQSDWRRIVQGTMRHSRSSIDLQVYVYAFGLVDTPYVKIGISSCPKTRLKSLQTGTPLDLFVIGIWPVSSSEIEAEVHAHFHNIHKKREWFIMGEVDIAALHKFMEDKQISFIHAATVSSARGR